MDCKKAQLLIVPHILGDLEHSSRQCQWLKAHLLSCQFCAEEYKYSKKTIEFINTHKVEFATAFESIDKNKVAEQEEIKKSWQGIQAKLAKSDVQEKQAKFRRTLWKITAAAACIVIGISLWFTLSNSNTFEESTTQQVAIAPAFSFKIELLSDNGTVIIPAGQVISTSTGELKTLVLNDKHQLIMNTNTTLSIKPTISDERIGCIVKLALGQIYSHVEPDGNPFVVSTAHGKAIITGTTFDIRATDATTTLVVAQGIVQFESEKGVVEVTAGQTSKIVDRSVPTQPLPCNTVELTAWATQHELKTTLAKVEDVSDTFDLTDLGLPVISGPIDLENMDYKNWVKENRDWFNREFPWIFYLKDALAQEGIYVDYPELLMKSGDIWQFVYPKVLSSRIPVLNPNSILKVISQYGFDEQWLTANIPVAKLVNDKPAAAKNRFIGLKAFEEWMRCFEQVHQSPASLNSGTLLYSLHASIYLANTRTLAWFSINNGQKFFEPEDKTSVLALLQTEVNTANKLTERIIELLQTSQSQPCDVNEYHRLVNEVIDYISSIMNVEERILEYEARK
jgi:hypothetical protein